MNRRGSYFDILHLTTMADNNRQDAIERLLRSICPNITLGEYAMDMMTISSTRLAIDICDILTRRPLNWQMLIIARCSQFEQSGGSLIILQHVYHTDDSGIVTSLYEYSR